MFLEIFYRYITIWRKREITLLGLVCKYGPKHIGNQQLQLSARFKRTEPYVNDNGFQHIEHIGYDHCQK